MLDIPTALAALHLPVENAKFLISVVARQVLTGVQKFASGGATVLNDTAFREIGSGMAEPGEFAARPMGMMAGHPTFVSTHIATTTAGTHRHLFLPVGIRLVRRLWYGVPDHR